MPVLAHNSPFSPLRNPQYRSYWCAGLIANFGWLIQSVGAAWLMMSISGSAQMVAMVQSAVSLPMMMCLILAGTLADRLGRRAVILIAQTGALCISIALAIWAWMDWLTPWSLLALTFGLGVTRAFNHPAWQTYVSDFMPRAQLSPAINLNSLSFNIARAVGPALGGVIVASFGAVVGFVINAVVNVAMVATMIMRKDGRAVDTQSVSFCRSIIDGARYVLSMPVLMQLTLFGAIFNFAGTALMALMPIIAREILNGGAEVYGLLLGAFGFGAIIIALFSNYLREKASLVTLTRSGFAVSAMSNIMVVASPSTMSAMIACATAGAAWVLTLSGFHTKLQLTSSREFMSRSNAIFQTFSFAGVTAGALVWGGIAERTDIVTTMIGSSIAMGTGILLSVAIKSRI